jgi:transposase InsO family protein
MSRKGNPYDNAFAESFIKTLKYEEIYLSEYRTFNEIEHLMRRCTIRKDSIHPLGICHPMNLKWG